MLLGEFVVVAGGVCCCWGSLLLLLGEFVVVAGGFLLFYFVVDPNTKRFKRMLIYFNTDTVCKF